MESRVVVGLGNPGPRYAGTRHNAGFVLAHRLVDRTRARRCEKTDQYEAWTATLALGGELRIVTPLTFMNRSGEALLAFGQRHDLVPERCLVVVDDVYLPLGVLRIRPSGG